MVFETPTVVPIITVQEKEAEITPTEPVHTPAEADVHVTDTNNEEVTPHHQTAENTLQILPFASPMHTQGSDQQPVCTSHNDATMHIYYESPLRVNSSEQ